MTEMKGEYYNSETLVTQKNEYMVNGTQIVYVKYESTGRENEIGYFLVNYVEGGKVPFLEKRKGVIRLDSLQCVETDYSSWLDK